MTSKLEYKKFLEDNFKGLRLRKPLFYSWNIGLRFDLQVGPFNTDSYFQEVTKRASTIFQTAFDLSDQVFLVLMEYQHKRRKIRFSNYAFTQIDNLIKSEVAYTKEIRLYDTSDKLDIRNVAIIKLTTKRINHKNILTAIGHTDFPTRQPRLDKNGFLSDKEIYFVKIDQKLIFHMYDDRGIDIIAADKDTLRPIYNLHRDWILDYDRERIVKQFI